MTARLERGITKTDIIILLVVAVALAAAVFFVAGSNLFGTRGPRFAVEFSYREQPRDIPPELVKYDKALSVTTGFNSASALAVDPADRIYVAGDGSIAVWDPAGKRLRTVVSGLAQDPRCIAVDDAGRIYAGIGPAIRVYSPAGEQATTLPAYSEQGVVTRVIPSDEGVFAAVHESLASGLIVRYDAAGNIEKVIKLSDMELLSRFLDIAVVSDGLRITNPGAVQTGRIRVYGFDGQFRYDWGRYDTTGDLANLSGCCNPVHVAALPDGRIVTAEKGAQVIIKVYHKDTPADRGRIESVVAELKEAQGLDLAVDSKQRILVLDTRGSAVHVFQRKRD